MGQAVHSLGNYLADFSKPHLVACAAVLVPLLACKPATLADWVYRELHLPAPGHAFCAVGHSNGATEIGYMLSRYNQADLFDLVAMESGPNGARLDYSCVREPAFPELFDTQYGRNTIDLAFGYPDDGSDICARQDVSRMELFRRTGIILDYATPYYYPDTMIAIMVSADDKKCRQASR